MKNRILHTSLPLPLRTVNYALNQLYSSIICSHLKFIFLLFTALLCGLLTSQIFAQQKQRLSWPVNSEYSELSPSLSMNGKSLVFQSDREGGKGSYDIYEARWLNGKWQAPLQLEHVNTPYFEGYPRLSPDGNTLFFSTNRHRQDKRSEDLNIWVSQRNEQGIWQPPQEFTALNSEYFEAAPSFSADNRTVYFSSTRPGGQGGADIFMSQLVEGGWSYPQALDAKINSPADEVNPQLLLAGDRLFFSSNRKGGSGGYDLYSTSRPGAGAPWKPAENAGNLYNDEENLAHFFIQENSGLIYASTGKRDEEEIYQQSATELGVNAIVLLQGVVKEKVSDRPVGNIMLQILNLRPTKHAKTDFIFPEKTIYQTDSQGQFIIYLPRGQKLVLAIDEPAYAPVRKVYDLKKPGAKVQLSEIFVLLPRPEAGAVPGAFFPAGEARPTEESIAALDILIAKWKASRDIIYLKGLVDAKESLDTKNRGLGFRRAETLRAYMLSKGIEIDRIRIIGQGIGGPEDSRFNEKLLARQRIVEIKTKSR